MAKQSPNPILQTQRFELRPLTPEDATNCYLSWLANENARRYIIAARKQPTLDDLRAYIESRCDRPDALFLGIFERASGRHIGNLKFEPIDETSRTAEMGILIGESDWRGQGVAREVITASAWWLRKHRGIQQILLGVEQDNLAALAAYRRTGFRPTGIIRDPRAPGEIVRMSLEIETTEHDRR